MKLVATFNKVVSVSLSERQRFHAFGAINKAFTGRESVREDDKISDDHRKAHWVVQLADELDIAVDIYEDGTKKYRLLS